MKSMSEICDLVAERVALGEPLGDAADHAATCARCQRLVALPRELGAHHKGADPGIGFAARMTAGAQHRIVVRRRRRIAASVATAVAAAAVIVLVVMRAPEREPVAVTPPPVHHDHDQPAGEAAHGKDPWKSHEVDADVRALVHLANIERSSHLSARWSRIEKPLAPYRALVKETQP